MTWSQARSRQRVRQFLSQAPQIKGALPDYTGGSLQARQRLLREQAGVKAGGALDQLSPSTAIVVDGVHVYVQLLGFDDMLLENARETEASHRRALILLHFYYRLLDQLVLDGDGIRVDFHGARMHFVVAEPTGPHAGERVARALAIVEALEEAAISLPAQLGLSIPRAPLRIGMDQGPCIAIANDRGHDFDTVFLGTPANLAAKLAAGDEPGIYLSPSVRQLLNLPPVFGLDAMRASPAPPYVRTQVKKSADLLIERAADAAAEQAEFDAPNFVFQAAELPLSTLKFENLSPSRSVRMDMAAVFADLDAFTHYVETSMQAGAGRSVVCTMFVLREEQRAVLREDFKAKRLRFVGDCIIGLSASGEGRDVSPARTVEDAVRCAAALHSSLEVCREEMADAAPLGLQVGVAFGSSPLTRLGIRGDMSVRCAASRAIMQAEQAQTRAERGLTVVADSALTVSTRVAKLADGRNQVTGKFAAVETLLTGAPMQLGAAIGVAGAASTARAAPPFRAHGGGEG